MYFYKLFTFRGGNCYLYVCIFILLYILCIFRVSGNCKHVGALLWYIEQEVRLGHNQTCTSKPQKWHIPSKKQQRLHAPATLNEITIKKPKIEIILQEDCHKTCSRSKFDPRAKSDRKMNEITENDLDTLADATEGKCSIVLLMRKHDVKPNPDIDDISLCIEVSSAEHIEEPPTIDDAISIDKLLLNDWKDKILRLQIILEYVNFILKGGCYLYSVNNARTESWQRLYIASL